MKESKLVPFAFAKPGCERLEIDWVRINDEDHQTEAKTYATRQEFFSTEVAWPRKAARVFLVNDEGKVLIGKRSEEDSTEGGKWEIIGGKVDAGEESEQAILREIIEEVGIEASVEYWTDIVNMFNDKTWKMDLFVSPITAEQVDLIRKSEEHDEFAFVDVEDLDRYEWAFGLYGELLRRFFEAF